MTDLNRASGPAFAFVSRWGAALAFALCAIWYGVYNFAAAQGRGIWGDECATVILTNPNSPLATLIADTHPPVYYLSVRLLRTIGIEAQAALFCVNVLATAGFGALAWYFLRHRPRFALALLGVILIGPAVMTFALEGRNYALAQSASLALSAALIARLDARPGKLWRLVLLAAITSTTHLFAALFVCALGGALMVVSLARKDRSEALVGIGLAGAAICVVGVWLAIAAQALFGGENYVAWIPNTLAYTTGQFWYFNKMLSGFGAAIVLLGAALVLSLLFRPARAHAFFCLCALALFCIAPVVISIKMPVLAGRYLAVAAPSLVLLAAHAVWIAFQNGAVQGDPIQGAQPRRALAAGAGAAMVIYLCAGALAAPAVATRMTNENLRDKYVGRTAEGDQCIRNDGYVIKKLNPPLKRAQ